MSLLARLLFQNPNDYSLLVMFPDIVLSLIPAPYALFLKDTLPIVLPCVHIVWDF